MDSMIKTALITGGTNGIGKATALELSLAGINVTIVGQSPEKCNLVSEQIQESSGNRVDWIAADLSTLNGIAYATDEFRKMHSLLHILINNAGAFFNHCIITEDGYEKTFALNHLNYFLTTYLLLDLIKNSPNARIINVSSIAHASVKEFDFDNLQGDKHFFGWDAYSRSKLCNLFFSYELARILSDTNITVNALHPGYVASGFATNNGPFFKKFTTLGAKLFAKRPKFAAETIIHLALSPKVEGITGKYFRDCNESKSSPLSYDKSIASRLWQTSLKMTAK